MSDIPPPRKQAYSVPDVAVILGVNRTQVYWLIRNGQLGALKCGREFRISEYEVDRFLRSANVA